MTTKRIVRTHAAARAVRLGIVPLAALTMATLGMYATEAGAATPNLRPLMAQDADMPELTPNAAEDAPQGPYDLNAIVDLVKGGLGSTKAEIDSDITHLREDKVIAEMSAALGSPGPAVGITSVDYFKTPASARSYASYEFSSIYSGVRAKAVAEASGEKLERFDAGVTGADSFATTTPPDPTTQTPTQRSTESILTSGHCVVTISLESTASSPPPTTSIVATADKKVAERDKRPCA